jgi:hypothetical protein
MLELLYFDYVMMCFWLNFPVSIVHHISHQNETLLAQFRIVCRSLCFRQNRLFLLILLFLVSGPRGERSPAIKRKLDSILPDDVWRLKCLRQDDQPYEDNPGGYHHEKIREKNAENP